MGLSGFSYPFALTSQGRWAVASGLSKVRVNLEQIANTTLLSRWYEPNAGSNAPLLVFDNPSSSNMQLLADELTAAFIRNEPRALPSVSVYSDGTPGVVRVVVRYTLVETNEQDQFEFEMGGN